MVKVWCEGQGSFKLQAILCAKGRQTETVEWLGQNLGHRWYPSRLIYQVFGIDTIMVCFQMAGILQ